MTEQTPAVGEIVALTGFETEPWVLTLALEDGRAKVALVETVPDCSYTAISDATFRLLQDSVGDRERRRRVATNVDENTAVSKLWVPCNRLDRLGSPGIQGCDRPPDATKP